MHQCDGPDCRGCRAEAAKIISDWGSEGIQAAARIVGNDRAEGMLTSHVRRNVEEMHRGASPDEVARITQQVLDEVFPRGVIDEEAETIRRAADIPKRK